MLDPEPLLQELKDPKYASLLKPSRDDAGIHQAINTPDPDVRVPRGDISIDELRSDFAQEISDILTSNDEQLRAKWLGILQYQVFGRQTITISGVAALSLMLHLKADGLLRDRRYRIVDDAVLGSIRVPASDDDESGFLRKADDQIYEERTRIGTTSEKLYGRALELGEVSEILNGAS